MSTWHTFRTEAPDLSAAVQARFEANTHHVLATLRADGSPRVSGTEVKLVEGDLWLGSMPDARKALDLRRDPRCALHSTPSDAEMVEGDAKVDAIAVEVTDEPERERIMTLLGGGPGPGHVFRLDLQRVVLTTVEHDPDQLVVTTWRPDAGVTTVTR